MSFTRSFLHSFIPSFVHSFIRSFVLLSTLSTSGAVFLLSTSYFLLNNIFYVYCCEYMDVHRLVHSLIRSLIKDFFMFIADAW